MKKSFIVLLLTSGIILMNACKTDFDVTSEYKEIAIVYGLLNQKESTQYLRITKAFLGDGNALNYARVADSSSFGSQLSITLQEIKNDQVIREIPFDTTTIHDKDSGLFYSPEQVVYKANALLDSSCIYVLKAINSSTGYEVNSVSNLIYGLKIAKPMPSTRLIDMKRAVTSTQAFEWYSAVNGRRYQPILRFYYKELSPDQDTITRMVSWTLSTAVSNALSGGEKISFYYLNEEFYIQCNSQIPYEDPIREGSVVRFADRFELFMTIIGDEFNTYLDVNGPSTGLLLEKPSYSNINNGIGMFSCRYYWNKTFKVGENAKTDLKETTNLHFKIN